MTTIIVLVVSAIAYFAFSKTMLGKKFNTTVGSLFNSGLDDISDPVKKLKFMIDKNVKLIKDLAYQYAELRAEIDIIKPKINDLINDISKYENKRDKAIRNDNKAKGTQAIAMINSKTRLKAALESQLEKLVATKNNLVTLRDKLKHKNDLAAAEITILASRKDINNNLRGLSENLVDMDTDNGDIVEQIEKEILTDEYLVEDNLKTLEIDAVDTSAEEEWNKLTGNTEEV